MKINLEMATDLVMQATTECKIKHALAVLKFPGAYGAKLEITEYQKDMMMEQLEINSCNLEVNGCI